MPLVPFTAPLPLTDGQQVAVWTDAAGIRVAEDYVRISEARTLRASGCAPAAVAGSRLALECGEGNVRLRDLATDQESVPAGATRIQADLSANFTANGGAIFRIAALGSRSVGIQYNSSKGGGSLRYELATGKRLGPPLLRSDQVPSLDSASGVTKLCAPLRITTARALDSRGEISRVRDSYAFSGAWLLVRHGSEMRLHRCGSRGFTVIGRATAMQPVLTSRYAAWATRARVYVRGFRTGTTRSFALRNPPGGSPGAVIDLRATERRLWIEDARGVRLLDL